MKISSLIKCLLFFLVFFVGATLLVHDWSSYLIKVPSGLGILVCLYGLLDYRKLSAIENEELLNRSMNKDKQSEADALNDEIAKHYNKMVKVRMYSFVIVALIILALLYCFFF